MTTVTLQQIADQAGVTRGQVSRVLNNRYKENRPAIARKAQKIRDIAAELGYRPNTAARSITRGNFGQVAFVTCGDLGFDWFAPELLHGVHQAIEQAGQRLMISEMSAERMADAQHMPKLFSESSVDGMLINLDGKLSGDALDAFDAQPVPIVLLNQKRKTRCVYPDEVAGGAAAARHLLDDGRKKIGYVCLTPESNSPHYSRFDRLDGVRSELSRAGHKLCCVLDGDERYEGHLGNGEQVVSELLDNHIKLDAVVCYSLTEALAVYLASIRRGLNVPDDLRIVVFNHQLAHSQTGVPIDTVIVPFKRVGLHATQMLRSMIDKGAKRPRSQAISYRQLYAADRREMIEIEPVSGPGDTDS